MKKVFPYPVLAGDVTLRVTETVVDNTSLAISLMNDAERVIALQELKTTKRSWEEVRIRVEVRADESELAEGPWTSPVCIATVSNRRTHVSDAFPLRNSGRGLWSGEVELRREEHLGRTEIGARIVAEISGAEGRLVGIADNPWYADFDAKRPTQQRSLPMRWLDFTDEANTHLHEFRNDPWLLEADANEPVLCLNSSVEGMRGVLEHASTPEQKVVREVLASQIASEAWATMFNSALAACGIEGGGPEWPGSWHEDVLRRMLPDVFPDMSPDEALGEMVRRGRSGENGGELQTKLMHAASVQSKKPRNVAAAMKNLARMASAGETG